MNWFKFYGGDYLSDPKMLSLSASERSCWITLLAYGSVSEDGVVSFLSEKQLMVQAGIDFTADEWDRTTGVLKKLEKLNMIRCDDDKIMLVNWRKRQEVNLTAYERTKRYRQNNADKIRARSAVQRAVVNGDLVKASCEICGEKRTEAHHEDYSKPLDVRWFCKNHHENRHHDDTMMTLEENRVEKKRIELVNNDVSEVEIKSIKVRDRKERPEQPIDLELATSLFELIQANTPTFKEPNLQSWAKHVRLMRERDKRTPEQIQYLINWSQKDTFWQGNILSTSKLREKFDQLVAQVKRQRLPVSKGRGLEV